MTNDKYTDLFSDKAGNRELLLKADKCDKYDYLTAVGCGVLGGLIDIFFVGEMCIRDRNGSPFKKMVFL